MPLFPLCLNGVDREKFSIFKNSTAHGVFISFGVENNLIKVSSLSMKNDVKWFQQHFELATFSLRARNFTVGKLYFRERTTRYMHFQST